MSELTLVTAERNCLAAPASWIMTTENGDEVVVRYRHGTLTIKHRETRDELFREFVGDSFDGHLTLYEVRDELQNSPVEFSVTLPREFYGFPVDDCDLEVFGDWITGLSCESCDWSLSSEEIPTFEYETVLPPHCPNCRGEFAIETETPAKLKQLQEEEDFPEDLLDTLDGTIQD